MQASVPAGGGGQAPPGVRAGGQDRGQRRRQGWRGRGDRGRASRAGPGSARARCPGRGPVPRSRRAAAAPMRPAPRAVSPSVVIGVRPPAPSGRGPPASAGPPAVATAPGTGRSGVSAAASAISAAACAAQLNAPKPYCAPWLSPLIVTAPAAHIAPKASNGTQRGDHQPSSSTTGTASAARPPVRASTAVTAATASQYPIRPSRDPRANPPGAGDGGVRRRRDGQRRRHDHARRPRATAPASARRYPVAGVKAITTRPPWPAGTTKACCQPSSVTGASWCPFRVAVQPGVGRLVNLQVGLRAGADRRGAVLGSPRADPQAAAGRALAVAGGPCRATAARLRSVTVSGRPVPGEVRQCRARLQHQHRSAGAQLQRQRREVGQVTGGARRRTWRRCGRPPSAAAPARSRA